MKYNREMLIERLLVKMKLFIKVYYFQEEIYKKNSIFLEMDT